MVAMVEIAWNFLQILYTNSGTQGRMGLDGLVPTKWGKI